MEGDLASLSSAIKLQECDQGFDDKNNLQKKEKKVTFAMQPVIKEKKFAEDAVSLYSENPNLSQTLNSEGSD